jgi:hypothetical protein
MKITFQLLLLSLVFIGMAPLAKAQTPEITHNSWTSGTAMPTARMSAAAGAIGTNIYVIGGYVPGNITGVNEIYNTKTNKWTTGASDPNPRAFAGYAVVNKILYIFGGSNGSFLNIAESYDPATDTWTTLASMLHIQAITSAVADKDVIYVIGGLDDTGFLTTVESYNITTNTWTEEAPLLVAKGWSAVGLLGTTVVAADGGNSSNLGDNEGYNVKKNTWSELAADPTPRAPGCYAAIKGQLYVAGGQDVNGNLITLNEAYSPKTKSWTTLAPMPVDTGYGSASADAGSRLYCFGGGSYPSTVYDNVQIYQP